MNDEFTHREAVGVERKMALQFTKKLPFCYRQLQDVFYNFKKMKLLRTTGSFCCQNNHIMLSIIQTKLFTLLTIMTIRPSPTSLQ